MSRDTFGHPLLLANNPVSFSATLWRSSTRCDPAGEWRLRFSGDVVVDGHHLGVASARDAPLRIEIPTPEQSLRMIEPDDARHCGLAARVYLEQGEPEVEYPAPSRTAPQLPSPAP